MSARHWRKHRVRVTLVAETQVELEVEVPDGDDPTDLTPTEYQRALGKAHADCAPEWEVRDVRLAPPPPGE